MRVRVSCDASAGSLRFLLRVPHDLELVADFVRHLHLRLPQKVTSLVLRVGGFALLPTLRLADVLRDDDEVCVAVAGSDERPPIQIQSSVPMAALPDSATAPVASAEKRRRVRDSRDSVAGKHADTPPKTQQLPPYPPVPPATAVVELAKKPKDAGTEDVPTPPSKARKEAKQSKPKVWVSAVSAWSWFYRVACTSTEQGALVTSKQAAAEARQAQASTRNSSSFLWLPGKVLARSRQPSEEPQDEDMQQAICSLLNSLVQEGNKQSDLCIATTLPSLSLITGKLR